MRMAHGQIESTTESVNRRADPKATAYGTESLPTHTLDQK